MDETDDRAGQEPRSFDNCDGPRITQTQALLDNLPYLAMLTLGAAIFSNALGGGLWGGLTAALYALYGIGGALWIMLFVCPYCHFFGTRLCPCGYGQLAEKLRAKQDGDRFRQQFRRHIPVIVPLWLAPVLVAVYPLVRQFSGLLLALLLAFAVNSFVILPLVSRLYGCARCPQKQTCPWMGGCKRA
jgi:hypothetical protein